jgi:hypothetical protein
VDALSCRHEEDTVVHALSVPNFILLDEFRVEAEHLLGIVAKHAQIDIRTAGLEWALVDCLDTCNIGSLTGKLQEVVDTMISWRVNILCVHETKWNGQKTKDVEDTGFKL